MCNRYCLTKGPQPILKLARTMKERMGRANALGIVARRGKEDEEGLAVWRS